MSDLLKRIADYFSNEYQGDDETAPKMELSVDDLRYIASMNVDRCRAETELREAKKINKIIEDIDFGETIYVGSVGMTEYEAIARIIDHFDVHHHDNRPHPLLDKAVEMAIKALEEIQQYREIGTPEECRAAMEKQTEKWVKTLDEVVKACDIERGFYSCDVKNLTRHILMRVLNELRE